MDQPADTEKDRLNTGSGLRAHLIVRFLSSVLAASRVSTVSTELCTRIVRRLHCEPLRNAMRNPSATVKSTSNGPVNRRLGRLLETSGCARKLTLARSPIPMFDRKDHPSVPTCCPWRKAAGGGQGGPQAIAKRREACLRATHRLATLWQGGRSVTLPLPTIPQATARLNQRLPTELKFRTRLYQSR
jgi:hypothetical protein